MCHSFRLHQSLAAWQPLVSDLSSVGWQLVEHVLAEAFEKGRTLTINSSSRSLRCLLMGRKRRRLATVKAGARGNALSFHKIITVIFSPKCMCQFPEFLKDHVK